MEREETAAKRALLDRWHDIEQEENLQDGSEEADMEFRKIKEDWFSDAFSFLIKLKETVHIWCDHEDVMWPLLEPFSSYFDNNQLDCPLKVLWKRICRDLEICTECIIRHHKAQDLYKSDFEEDVVKPLLSVLQTLDEERIATHLRDINTRTKMKEPSIQKSDPGVVSVLFEVLMNPHLLEDQAVANEFVPFLIEVEKSYDLTLSGNQQYPGVYPLMFFPRTQARAIGFRLAGYLGKMSKAFELEPIQPWIKKSIYFLDNSPLLDVTKRPRVQYEKEAVWLGIKSLIGFLGPSAFEEGIVERYPIFLSMVLNHVSDDSTKNFMHAVDCLRLLFENLGCKLWLRTTFSPSVMRNTLLGQCFHTCTERHHKAIFNLFEPFLQSLEALQDGEFERQRRHFLYFLLHQVSHSNNFSLLMKKKARQIAIFLVTRGYKMDPPCPPFECAHMWADCLISSVKDRSLFDPFRRPAFHLIQTIIVADAAALVSLWKAKQNCNVSLVESLDDTEEDDELQCQNYFEESNSNGWNDFSNLWKQISKGCHDWFCIPLLWMNIFQGMSPSTLPLSISKSVIWALSRLSCVQPEGNSSMEFSFSKYFQTIGTPVSWDIPKGCDDGSDGKGSANSVCAATYYGELIRLMRRFCTHYAREIESSQVIKQWTWEPKMGETVILMLLDANDVARHCGKIILEQVSGTQGLHGGLQFLCSSQYSITAMLSGLRYAVRMLLSDSLFPYFPALQHLYFVTSKLLSPGQNAVGNGCSQQTEHFSNRGNLDGGFLRPSLIAAPAVPMTLIDASGEQNDISLQKFREQLSECVWPLILKCLSEGKAFVQEKAYQMTFVRLFEILPKMLKHYIDYQSRQLMPKVENFTWLYDFVEWGKSELLVVKSHWKQAFVATLRNVTVLLQREPEIIMSRILESFESGAIAIEWLQEQVSLLSLDLSQSGASPIEGQEARSCTDLASSLKEGMNLLGDEQTHNDDIHARKYAAKLENVTNSDLIIISDDEIERESKKVDISELPGGTAVEKLSHDFAMKTQSGGLVCRLSPNLQEENKDYFAPGEPASVSSVDSTNISSSKRVEIESQIATETVSSRNNICPKEVVGKQKSISSFSINRKEAVVEKQKLVSTISEKKEDYMIKKEKSMSSMSENKEDASVRDHTQKHIKQSEKIQRMEISKEASSNLGDGKDAKCREQDLLKTSNKMVKTSMPPCHLKSTVNNNKTKLESAEDHDPLESALDAARKTVKVSAKATAIPKRQTIHLQMPLGNIKGNYNSTKVRCYKPPRLDEWYKRILQLDYFSTVGISLRNGESENLHPDNLSEVPTSFQSSDHYIDVFRPLVLEEFKAQLRRSFEEVSSPEEMCCGKVRLLSLERVDDFQIVRFMPDAGADAASKGSMENDLILLSREPIQTVSQNVHLIGKVDRRERDAKSRCVLLVTRLYINPAIARLAKARRLLVERSRWYLTRLMSITPQLREFQALSAAKDNPLLPVIINPYRAALECCNSSDLVERECQEFLPAPLKERFKAEYNESQLKAINDVIVCRNLKTECKLSLIQGPPGTGKTRTILAISSSFLMIGNQVIGSDALTTSRNTNRTQVASRSLGMARLWRDADQARYLASNNGAYTSKEIGKQLPQKRVLICAQSNAAVDELVSRICANGIYNRDGLLYKPYVVRVGNIKTVHSDSLSVFIDTLVDQRLGDKRQSEADSNDEKAHSHTSALRLKLEKVVETIRLYEAQRSSQLQEHSDINEHEHNLPLKDVDTARNSGAALSANLNILYRQKKDISTELAVAEADEKRAFEQNKALKQDLRRDIIREAEIIVTTLSSCGGDIFSACVEAVSRNKNSKISGDALFDAVIIDEAAQALEPATLIPMQLLKPTGVCVMVGDPKQLPATVLSQIASKYSYECSMFERLQRAGYPVTMLSIQYRMHPEICRFPSAHFYDNHLKDATTMTVKRIAQFHENHHFRPFVFYDVQDGYEQSGVSIRSQSLRNESETLFTLEILKSLKLRYPQEFDPGRIGIVTPYKQQLNDLRRKIDENMGPSIARVIEFNTVDGFQGREVDIVVFSTVRASDSDLDQSSSKSYGIGFVSDVRRMNVALTRAKFSLWIVGNAQTLCKSPHWAALVRNAKERGLIFSVRRPYKFTFSSGCSGLPVKNYCSNTPEISMKELKSNAEACDLNGESGNNYIDVLKERKRECHGEPPNLKHTTKKAGSSNISKYERKDTAGKTTMNRNVKKHRSAEDDRTFPARNSSDASQRSTVNLKGISKEISQNPVENQRHGSVSHSSVGLPDSKKREKLDKGDDNISQKDNACSLRDTSKNELNCKKNDRAKQCLSSSEDGHIAFRKRRREEVNEILPPGALLPYKKPTLPDKIRPAQANSTANLNALKHESVVFERKCKQAGKQVTKNLEILKETCNQEAIVCGSLISNKRSKTAQLSPQVKSSISRHSLKKDKELLEEQAVQQEQQIAHKRNIPEERQNRGPCHRGDKMSKEWDRFMKVLGERKTPSPSQKDY